MIHDDFPNRSLDGSRDSRLHDEVRLAYSEMFGDAIVEIWAAPVFGHRGFRASAKKALRFWTENGMRDRMVTNKAYPGYFLISRSEMAAMPKPVEPPIDDQVEVQVVCHFAWWVSPALKFFVGFAKVVGTVVGEDRACTMMANVITPLVMRFGFDAELRGNGGE
ncbi:hypothetical protein [Shinella granuli]|uniref:hypothetical protein n=1 Tax=Shinella granuli TaxID=323621 RepID=UPI00105624A3|nr:hypothetical protein [Shinella granuli]